LQNLLKTRLELIVHLQFSGVIGRSVLREPAAYFRYRADCQNAIEFEMKAA
jgi:hypothetical protein